MAEFRKKIDQFLQDARLAISNAQSVTEVAEGLALFGFDATVIQTGATLLAEAESLHAAQVQEYAEQYQATAARDEARQAVDKDYSIHRRLARLALKGQPEAQKALLLHEAKKRSFSGSLAQAKVFYTNLFSNPQALAAIAKYNITEEKLSAAQQAIANLEALEATQKQEISEAQEATKARDAALDALDEWLSDLREIAQIALADTQQLEALGFGTVS